MIYYVMMNMNIIGYRCLQIYAIFYEMILMMKNRSYRSSEDIKRY